MRLSKCTSTELALKPCGVNLKAAIKEDTDWYSRCMPLTEVIVDFVIDRSLVRMIEQVIDENGSVKDSAVCNRSHTIFLFLTTCI
ncbi:hypothetical protein K1719_017868 [Acacia pycnantha]|nr:hypothetical protein K1719_017868 [Acacia pycnantha]